MAQQTQLDVDSLLHQMEPENAPSQGRHNPNLESITPAGNLTSNGTERPNATSRATAKAGAYGGGELGSVIGNSLCCCGGIIGNCIGEKYGEKAVENSGLNKKVGKARNKLGNVIGDENVDKAGEIALTAFGYGDDQYCACFPCMPSSQILLFIMFAFYIYNWYRLVIGVGYKIHCTNPVELVGCENIGEINDNRTNNFSTGFVDIGNNATTNDNEPLVEYPCEFGFDYLVFGAAVWICYLPFYIMTLLGNCWRQCCCCLCDPCVCLATIYDFLKRYLCECGKFSCIDFVWYSMCIFQVIWGCCGLYWLVTITYFADSKDNFQLYAEGEKALWKIVLASIILDIALAGSEIFHKVLLHVRSTHFNQVQNENTQTN